MPLGASSIVKRKHEEDSTWTSALIAQAQARGFYGKLVLTFQDGRLRHVEKQESLKPPSELGDNSSDK